MQVDNSFSTFFQIVIRINVYVMLTWAWRVEGRRRSACGSQRWPGPAGLGSCRGAGPRCSSSAWSPPAPQPPPAAPPAGSAAPGADCGPSAPSASAAAQLSPPARGFMGILSLFTTLTIIFQVLLINCSFVLISLYLTLFSYWWNTSERSGTHKWHTLPQMT